MSDTPATTGREPGEEFDRAVRRKQGRRLRARMQRESSPWFGFGMFGLVGWSVALPTLAGIGLGIWLDRRIPMGFSWTLTLMFAGLVLGCMNAWRWLELERTDRAP